MGVLKVLLSLDLYEYFMDILFCFEGEEMCIKTKNVGKFCSSLLRKTVGFMHEILT
jgi:hypothetical protein